MSLPSEVTKDTTESYSRVYWSDIIKLESNGTVVITLTHGLVSTHESESIATYDTREEWLNSEHYSSDCVKVTATCDTSTTSYTRGGSRSEYGTDMLYNHMMSGPYGNPIYNLIVRHTDKYGLTITDIILVDMSN